MPQLVATGLFTIIDVYNGTRTASLDMYQWGATAPTTFPSGTSTYTWASRAFTAPATLNGWSLTPPTAVSGQTLWVCYTTYSDNSTNATSTVTWSASVSMPIGSAGANGATGATGTAGVNGQRVGVLEVYQWSPTAPTVFPTGTSTYTWATGAYTLPTTPNSWTLLPGASVAGSTLWGIFVSVSDNLTTATSTATWSSVTPYSVGYAGGNGSSIYVVALYQKSATAPTLPTGTSYNFSTDTLTGTLGSWSRTMPASDTTPNFMTTCTFSVVAPTVTQANSTWTAAIVMAQNGAIGAQGPSVSIATNRVPTFTSTDNILDAGQTSITFSLILSGITATTYAWTFYADGSTTPVTLSGVTVNAATCAITQANFASALAGVKSLKVVCIVNGTASYTDEVTIARLDNSTAAAGATIGANLYSTFTVPDAPLLTGMTVTTGNVAATYTPATGNLVSSALLSITASASNVLTVTGHGYAAGTGIVYNCAGTTISGLVNGTVYYIASPTANTFSLSTTAANALATTPVIITLGALTGGSTYTTSAYGWVYSGYSTTSQVATAGAKLTFTASAIAGSYAIGLSTNPTIDNSYASIDFAIYIAGSQYFVYENGANKGTFGTVIAGDKFSIMYNGAKRINYFINGINFYSTILTTNITLPIYIDTSIVQSGVTIYSIGFSAFVTPVLLSSGNLLGQIHPGNSSTYIANAAIQTAHIGDAQITTAKIGNLAVNTLQIAGNAVTVPTSFSAGTITLAQNVTGTIINNNVTFSGGVANIIVAWNSPLRFNEYAGSYMFLADLPMTGYLYVNGVLVLTIPYTFDSGAAVYSVTLTGVVSIRLDWCALSGFAGTGTVTASNILIIEAKK